MFGKIVTALRRKSGNDAPSTQRRHPRREGDRCVAVVNGQAYPVENWSPGGILIAADDRMFGVEQSLEFTIKFKLRNSIIDVSHRGHIVRKGYRKVAIAFEPLSKSISRAFQQIIDDSVAREFANSQAV
ncbi:MAG: PilZ domain-containing protein [Proteobacteria bacterium]|nr:PilZ domain-containing protein [Pseudomonadota bacterium]